MLPPLLLLLACGLAATGARLALLPRALWAFVPACALAIGVVWLHPHAIRTPLPALRAWLLAPGPVAFMGTLLVVEATAAAAHACWLRARLAREPNLGWPAALGLAPSLALIGGLAGGEVAAFAGISGLPFLMTALLLAAAVFAAVPLTAEIFRRMYRTPERRVDHALAVAALQLALGCLYPLLVGPRGSDLPPPPVAWWATVLFAALLALGVAAGAWRRRRADSSALK